MTPDRHYGITHAEGRSLLALVRLHMQRGYVSAPVVTFSPHRDFIIGLRNGWQFTPRPTLYATPRTPRVVMLDAA